MNPVPSNEPPQQWSVQAQFTVSHPAIDNSNNAPQTHTEYENNGVRMFYTWNLPPSAAIERNQPSRLNENSPSLHSYKFQKGDLLFTSEPPRKNQSSGYGSDVFSPNSSVVTSPRKPMQPYNQKCKSTCSIVLSTTINEQPEFEENYSFSNSHCDRTQSLRCQIPATTVEGSNSYFGCGDPWCYHSSDGATAKRPSRTNTFTPPFMQSGLKDAAVQTFEMVDKCTSPLFRNEQFPFRKKRVYSTRSTTEPVLRKSSQSSFTPDSLDNYKPGSNLVHTRAPSLTNKKSSESESKSNDPTKKPRTVHIDVYCTGTEQESDSNSSSEMESKTASSPQTVFESEKLKVMHSRSGNELPLKLQQGTSSKDSVLNTKLDDSDNDDNTSTAYPSQISSHSAITGLSSFASTIPPSWSTYSVDESLTNASWKDTFSDLDSLNPSRSSIALTDSLEFVPRKSILPQKSESIEEHPETSETPTAISLIPSDSFEYENSEDRFRIKQKEKAWNRPPLNSKLPQQDQSKYLFQQQKLKEYVEKRLSGITLHKSESKDSDSGSDVSEKGWSIVKTDDKVQQSEPPIQPSERVYERQNGSKRSPSIMAIHAKLSINPNLQSPFMMDPGIYTKQRNVAKMFGSVVDVFRKPGHHIGPAKNPECQCDHCRQYYQSNVRNRTRSAGEVYPPWMNWRRNSKQLQSQKELNMK